MSTPSRWSRFKTALALKWAQFKKWLAKNAPKWIQAGLDAAIQWLVPILLKSGLTFAVSEDRKARCEAAKLPREAVKIPPELEHEDDC